MTKAGAVKLDLEKYGSLLALGVLFLLATIIGWPYFIQPENLINVMRQSSYTGIIALGMTFVIISGGIDLSVGSVLALSTMIASSLLTKAMLVGIVQSVQVRRLP